MFLFIKYLGVIINPNIHKREMSGILKTTPYIKIDTKTQDKSGKKKIASAEIKCDHNKILVLPCEHDSCRVCFFENLKKGPVMCNEKDCKFTFDDMHDYWVNAHSDVLYIDARARHLGINQPKDIKGAEKRYLDAIEVSKKDDTDEIYYYADLGTLYYNDLDDDEKALKYYLKMEEEMIPSVRDEYSDELFNLAKLLLDEDKEGSGFFKKAHNILIMLSSKKIDKELESVVCYYLGDIYYHGGDGIKKDLVEAYKWYKDAKCYYSMGLIHAQIANYQKAVELFKSVPKDDEFYSDACIKLGEMYEHGVYFDKDYKSAMGWFKKAITEDDFMGYLRIGSLYERGNSTAFPKDYLEAGKYYNLFLEKNTNEDDKKFGYESLYELYKKMDDNVNSIKNHDLMTDSETGNGYIRIPKKRKTHTVVEE